MHLLNGGQGSTQGPSTPASKQPRIVSNIACTCWMANRGQPLSANSLALSGSTVIVIGTHKLRKVCSKTLHTAVIHIFKLFWITFNWKNCDSVWTEKLNIRIKNAHLILIQTWKSCKLKINYMKIWKELEYYWGDSNELYTVIFLEEKKFWWRIIILIVIVHNFEK